MAREDTEAFELEHDPGARRRRTIVTFLVVALLLFFAFWYAMSYIRADDARRALPKATPSASCPVAPADIRVNVYNGTTRDGLAAKVTGDLRKRGFVVGKVGNDPKGGNVAGAGQLRYGGAGAHQVRVLGRHVGEMEQVADQRKSAVVDVVLGKDFVQLVPLAEARGC